MHSNMAHVHIVLECITAPFDSSMYAMYIAILYSFTSQHSRDSTQAVLMVLCIACTDIAHVTTHSM